MEAHGLAVARGLPRRLARGAARLHLRRREREALRAERGERLVPHGDPLGDARHAAGGRQRDVGEQRAGQRERRVRHGARKIEEEGAALLADRAADEADRLRRHPLGMVRLSRRLPVRAPHGGRPLEAAVGAHVAHNLVVLQAARAANELRARSRPLLRQRKAEVVLADEAARVVAPRREHLGHGRLGAREEGVEAHVVPGAVRDDRARVRREAAGEQREARRRAQRRRRVRARERDAVASQRVNVRREPVRRAVRAVRVARDVVRDGEDDVRRR